MNKKNIHTFNTNKTYKFIYYTIEEVCMESKRMVIQDGIAVIKLFAFVIQIFIINKKLYPI